MIDRAQICHSRSKQPIAETLSPTEARAIAAEQVVWWTRQGVRLRDAARSIGYHNPQSWAHVEHRVAIEAMLAHQIVAQRRAAGL
jgi:Tfp pilus assembly protein PilZ